jgi:hypothetical protein
MIRLTNETVRLIKSLPPEKRAKVDAIVRRHIRACRKNGFLPENLERVFIEAVEMVEMQERSPEPPVHEPPRDWEPFRRYDLYISPRMA